MSWEDVVKKVKQDLKEPLQLDGLYATIQALDAAGESLEMLHQNNSENVKSLLSEEQYEKWWDRMESDKRTFISELGEMRKNIYTMLRTLNGKTSMAMKQTRDEQKEVKQ
tara:strand:- start:4043 stop:4372 length:330 start_codon:yes stop_codon:yes gene_type:complete